MTGAPGCEGKFISEIANIENRLAVGVRKAADEVAHVECFDDEQRSEVYAILQALKSDTDTHRQVVELLAEQLAREVSDA